MKTIQPPKTRPFGTNMAARIFLAVFVAFFVLFTAHPAGADEESEEPSPLAGMEVEEASEENILTVEIPAECRISTYEDEGFSLTVEDSEGSRTTVSSNETRVFMKDGRLAVVGESENIRGEVVEDEGFVCLDENERVLAETDASDTDETTAPESTESESTESESTISLADESSVGQQIRPLTATATANAPDGETEEGDVESITVPANMCRAGEEPTVGDEASVTLENSGGDSFVFTDGEDDVTITSDGSNITIAPTNTGDDFIPDSEDGGELVPGEATVVEQTGISCGAVDDDGADTPGNTSCATGQTFTDIAAFSRAATARETRQNDTFTTTGDFFRVSYRATATSTNDEEAFFEAEILGASDRVTDEFAAEFSGAGGSDTGQFTTELPAGTYRFRVVAENVQYDITVAECGTGQPSTSAPETSDPSRDVITNTVPNKNLANTGGPPLTLIGAGAVLAAFGAALFFIYSRRGA